MSGSLGVIIFIVTLIVMIMIHEAGHFAAARAFGMKVEEYFLGFGPRLFSWRRGETEYGVKAIMAGGYVKIAGMNPLQPMEAGDTQRPFGGPAAESADHDGAVQTLPEAEEHRMFRSKPAWQRAIVLAAGSATHFIVAAVLLTFSFAVLGVVGGPTTTLRSVNAGLSATGAEGPAATAGLRPGDRIVAIDGKPVASWDDMSGYIKARPGKPVVIQVDRGGQLLTFTVTPAPITDDKGQTIGRIGVSPTGSLKHVALPVAFGNSVKAVGSLIVGSIRGMGTIFSPHGIQSVFSAVNGTAKKNDQPVGLVGGARLASQAAQTGQTQSLVDLLAAFIVFLGVLNLAPLPPLDGGHLLVLLIEKIRGRPVDARKVVPVAAVVLVILVGLSLAILYADIIHPAANPFQ